MLSCVFSQESLDTCMKLCESTRISNYAMRPKFCFMPDICHYYNHSLLNTRSYNKGDYDKSLSDDYTTLIVW